MSKKQETEIEARLKEFWDDHKDFDAPWARWVLNELAHTLPFIFKFSALLPGLHQLYKQSGVRVPSDYDLTYEADELPAGVLDPLPIFKLELAIRAYADYGLLLQFPKEDEVDDDLIFDFLDRFPRQWMIPPLIQPPSAEGILSDPDRMIAAQARWKLDNHKGVTPDELAALARVSRKSIMNLAAPGKGGVLQKSSDDQITGESATRWLLSRPDFRRSIWQQQRKEFLTLLPKQATPSTLEPLFVPVARDGSWFSPAERHQRDGLYHVGNGDYEKQLDDYWTALDFLARAESPRWRYADTMGRWRIKMATGWERKVREEVEALLPRNAEAGKSITRETHDRN